MAEMKKRSEEKEKLSERVRVAQLEARRAAHRVAELEFEVEKQARLAAAEEAAK